VSAASFHAETSAMLEPVNAVRWETSLRLSPLG
jgi:hypothetical protein